MSRRHTRPAGRPSRPTAPTCPADRLAQAITLHQQGQLAAAERIYAEILAQNPGHFDALHLLGVAALQQGQTQNAADLIGKALRINPGHAPAHSNLGNALLREHRPEEALQCYAEALRLQPDYAEALNNQGIVLQRLGHLEEALASYAKALRIKPDYADALNNRGVALHDLGYPEEALDCYSQALRLTPDDAKTLNNQGNVLRSLGRPEEALACYDRALKLMPDYAKAHNNRGNALQDLLRHDEALASYQCATALQPDYLDALNNQCIALRAAKRPEEALACIDRVLALAPDATEALISRGTILLDLGRFEEALASYEQAVRLTPGHPNAHYNCGVALQRLGRPEDALARYETALRLKADFADALCNSGLALQELKRPEEALSRYAQALALQPGLVEAHWDEALTRLAMGDFERGWEKYEWRWKTEAFQRHRRNFSEPLWLGGESLQGRRILLHAEQGLGDAIQFCRYAKSVAALGATVLLEVHPPLKSLLANVEGVSQIFAGGEPLPKFDCHCPLLSLPLAFGTRLDSIPQGVPYLRADARRAAAWRAKLDGGALPRIGLAWSGNPTHVNDRNRSMPLAALSAALSGPAQFVSLQKEVRDADWPMLRESSDIAHYGADLGDFADTAGLIANLDLVLAVDTAVAHLAAALGKPVWLLLPFNPDWRWLLERGDSPWYPSMRLFRQAAPGDWGSALDTVANALRAFIGDYAKPAPPVTTMLQQAVACHQQGLLCEAVALYRDILHAQPRHVDALHLLGTATLQQGDAAAAARLIGEALALAPQTAAIHSNLGLALQALGRAEEALARYGEALRLQPGYAEALFNRGNALLDLDRPGEALDSFGQALRINPGYADALVNQGKALQALKRPEEALASYAQALRIRPDDAETWHSRGNVWLSLKRPQEAADDYAEALRRLPGYVAASVCRAIALQRLGRLQDALACCDEALRHEPGNIDLLINRGSILCGLHRPEAALASFDEALRRRPDHADALNNRGNAWMDLKRPAEALADYGAAIRISPGLAAAHSNQGDALQEMKRLDEALASYDEALRLQPDFPDALNNRGNTLLRLKRPHEALASFTRALHAKADHVEALNNQGSALQVLGRTEEALASFAQAIALKPDCATAHWNEALGRLLLGDYRRGWEKFEWRWRVDGFPSPIRNFRQPLWLGGEPLRGKTILLHAEQGLGDTLQFCRYAQRVAADGARVLLEVQPPLKALLAQMGGVSATFAQGEALPDFDCHCPLMSLPLAFGTQIDTIPAETAYLKADPERADAWLAKLGGRTALPRIGLAWSGSALHKQDPYRSIPLEQLAQSVHGLAQFVSLQREVRPDDLPALARRPEIAHFGDALADFADTAGLIANLDLVVAVDTAVAHLAAALGKPVWLLLPFSPDWRWLLGCGDSPWYPTVRLFRQTAIDDWDSALNPLAAALQAFTQTTAAAPSPGPTAELPERDTETLQRAISLHQQGETGLAETLYREILATYPANFDALHLLGVIALQHGDADAALGLIGRALASNPQEAAAHSNIGLAYFALGRMEEALVSYGEALRRQPAHAEAAHNQGNALLALNRREEALASYSRALQARPDYAEALRNRAATLHELGRLAEALDDYARLAALDPDDADAWCGHGLVLHSLRRPQGALDSYAKALQIDPGHAGALNNAGVTLQSLGRMQEALECHDRALRICPGDASMLNNRGNVLRELNRPQDALAALDQALCAVPDFAEAHLNRGNVLQELGRAEEARACHEEALRLKPGCAEALNNLGNALFSLRRMEEALSHYDRALRINPGAPATLTNRGNALRALRRNAEALDCYGQALKADPSCAPAHWNESLVKLAQGDFAAGWKKYEWRKAVREYGLPADRFRQPLWLGQEPLAGRTLLLHAEQGLGDTLQFCRYATLAAEAGAQVLLQVQAPLKTLLASLAGVGQIFAEGEALPDFDCQCPLLSLPLAFGTRLETIPAAPLYLYADAGRVHAWNARLGNQTRPRIGLAWSGNAKHKNDLCRSIPLAELGALAGRRGQFVSLQKEVRLADQAALKKRKDIAHFGGALSDFAETAALVANMDLVVTVDTAIAHLAGALGKPVWLLLPFNADWRWLQDRDDSPWYPSFRLFRQPAFGDWGSVIAEVGEALRLRLRTGRATPPPAAVRTGALPRPARRGKPHAPSSATLGPNFDALHQAGLQALSAGDMARGIELIRQALAAAQGDAAAHTNLGIALGRLGRFAEALDCYAQALRLQPDDAITLNGQGNALLNLGRAEEALACYRSALRQQPDFPEALNNQGNALRGLGRPQEALACYADAIRLRPGYADAHNNRGNALQDLGRWEEALASHAQALRLKPGDADALNNLGNAQRGLKRPEDALASYQSALRANPGHAQALNNCGNALLDLKRPEDALECYGRALRLQPDNAETLNNRGTALHLLGRADDALRDYAHALRLKPDYAEAHCNVGIILHGQNRFAEALDCYGRALRSRPDYAEALNNRGFTLQCLQRPAEALASYAQATRAKPDYGQAHWNHSMLLLALGDYEAGWRQYEWRWQAETFTAKKRDFSQPLWLGEESLRGKTILLHAEQGLGDTLQFCRYAKLVAAQGARVLLEVQPSLRALLARLEGVGEVVSRGDALPAFDCHCPLLSLPLACGTRLDSIPAEAAYLRADPGRVRHWRATLADTALPRIGLAWSGNPAHKNDHNRSLPLACLAPLLSAPAQFVSLQKDLRPEDAAFWESHGGLAHYGDRLADFEDTAALAANLDLVIAVDTSSAHLAAAMGKPVWLLLPFVPDWRWLMDRDGSPWYPSVRLFRQSAAGDWGGVVAAAANALAAQQWPAPQHLTTTTDPQP